MQDDDLYADLSTFSFGRPTRRPPSPIHDDPLVDRTPRPSIVPGSHSSQPHRPGVSPSSVSLSSADSTTDAMEFSSDDGDDDFYIDDPAIYAGRRGSVPVAIPGAEPSSSDSFYGRDREGSLATIRRPSRSLDDELSLFHGRGATATGDAGTSEPLSKGDWRSLEERERRTATPAPTQPTVDVVDLGFDASWFAELPRGITSVPVEEVARGSVGAVGPGDRRPSTQSWIRGWNGSLLRAGRGSVASGRSVGSDGDAFDRHAREYDADWKKWGFRRDRQDGEQRDVGGMRPGAEEVWACDRVGRFRVVRSKPRDDQLKPNKPPMAPPKPPPQQLTVVPLPPDIPGPPMTFHGPPVTIHKHSRARAFTIWRRYRRPGAPGAAGSVGTRRSNIMLATKRVQEQFTSTKTTGLLRAHGHLGDERAKSHGRPSLPPPPPPPVSAPARTPVRPSTGSSQASVTASTTTTDRTITPSTTDSGGDEESSDEDEDAPKPARTPYSEAYGAVDVLAGAHRHHHHNHYHHVPHADGGDAPGFLRRLIPRARATTGGGTGLSSAALQGSYVPQWPMMAPRSQQESMARVVEGLNESFKGVGLLPSTPTKGRSAGKGRKGGKSGRDESGQRVDIFENVPEDSLYMLLPLWPGETDPASMRGDARRPFVRVEDRQYMLVFYTPMPKGQARAGELHGTTSSSTTTLHPPPQRERRQRAHEGGSGGGSGGSGGGGGDFEVQMTTAFKVTARLIGYGELRGSGVLAPDEGLSVTGPLQEALATMPGPAVGDDRSDFMIARCYSREAGIVIDPPGVARMGLCYPLPPRAPGMGPVGEEEVEEVEMRLSPIGRAAVEMAWLGCMALTSFGSVR